MKNACGLSETFVEDFNISLTATATANRVRVASKAHGTGIRLKGAYAKVNACEDEKGHVMQNEESNHVNQVLLKPRPNIKCGLYVQFHRRVCTR